MARVVNIVYFQIVELIIYGGWVLGQSLSLAPNIMEALNAAGRLQYLFLRRTRIRDGPSAIRPFSNGGEAIEFSNVSFYDRLS